MWVWWAWPFPLLHTHQPQPAAEKKKKKEDKTQLFGALFEMPGPLLAKNGHESMNAYVWSGLSGTPSHISHPIMRSGAAVLDYLGPAWKPEAEIFTQSFLPLVASDIVNHTQMRICSLLSCFLKAVWPPLHWLFPQTTAETVRLQVSGVSHPNIKKS